MLVCWRMGASAHLFAQSNSMIEVGVHLEASLAGCYMPACCVRNRQIVRY